MIKGVTYILKNDATFQSLVGQNTSLSKYKVYPVVAAQTEIVPFSVVKMTGKTLMSKNVRNKFQVYFVVNSYSTSYDDVDAIDNAVIQALVPYRGTANGVAFDNIEFEGSFDDYIETYGGLYIRSTTFKAFITLTELT